MKFLLSQNITIKFLFAVIFLDAIVTMLMIGGVGMLIVEINSHSNVVGFRGIGNVVGLMLFPIYFILTIVFFALSIKVFYAFSVYKNLKDSGQDYSVPFKILKSTIVPVCINLVAGIFFAQFQISVTIQFLSTWRHGDELIILLFLIAFWISILYGLYRLIKKFYRTKIFWVICILLISFIVFLSLQVSPAAVPVEITNPDGSTQIKYFTPVESEDEISGGKVTQ